MPPSVNCFCKKAAQFMASKNAGPMDPPSDLEQRILSMTMQDGLIGAEIAEMMGW